MKIAVRRSLAYYIAASLATTLASPALAGNLTGPGSAHTVNPGDAPEAWTVSDRAELTLAAGSVSNEIRAVGGIVSANDAAISGANGTLLNALDGSTFSIAGGTIAASGPAARLGEVVDGSSIELAGVGMTSDGDGFVIASRTTETTLRISNSTLSTSGKALQVNPGGSLILEGTDVSVTGSAYAQGILTMGGTASISNSRIAGGTIGAEMSGGALTADRSTFDGELYGVFIGFSSSTGPEPTAAIYNSRITSRGAGALVDNGATLEIENTSIDAGEAGARVVDASFSASGSSTIVGELSGIDVARGTVNIDQSTVQGRTGDAILVYWPNGEATINISNASTLIAGSGVLVRTMAHTRATVNMASSSLSGDFVAEDGSTLDIALSEGANLRGSIIDGGAVSLSASGWTLAGNSNMASLNLGNGTVSLGDGSTFNTLNVSGNFTGADGTIVFNTVLADDDAATDKLIIGGDTSGTANVRVNNVGGAGAQTDKGIELIQVGGASNGQFNLAGRAVGGQYEYFLHKGTGADGNWYLRSQLPTQPDPCVIDPSLPECGPVDPVDPVDPIEPVPVLRPEPGAYLANLQAAQT
ncbi:autotransporter outer membrane beta-barrel domain-containing protein, partial [Stenotrophomonas maltophilia]|nr:autotransporter outer membrane beta-barrel domain-containing protein [Stenotrophomonas maltophilia]